MLISLNWLKKYIDLNEIDVKELENALTMIGQEVEHIEIKGNNLDNVITAQILEKEMHPDSDHLTLCKVDTGEEVLQIVCGAKNHKSGDKVVLAKIGAKLSPDFVIKKTKIRGQESNGMLCSEEEIGIGKDSSGIIILPEDAPIGLNARDYFGIDDVVFELEITPNRPDCLSHLGIARELAAYYDKKVKYPVTEISDEINEKTSDLVSVSIQDSELSRRYIAKIIKNIEIKESPKWLKEAVESIGMKSINNVVDVSNFVMMEMNQPNHIFDLDTLEGNVINVRRAINEEKFVTLDEVERTLTEDDIVIADAEKTIGLGGVMGGFNTEVTDKTKNILIEVADFNPQNIRKTSRRLNLSSEASYRFERRVDRSNGINVINRIANLIKEVAGGDILQGISEEYPVKPTVIVSELSLERLNRFVGKIIEKERVIQILSSLEINVEDKGEILVLTPPTFREDLENEQDYFEEIIRIYGFDNIENIMPKVDLSDGNVIDNTKFIDNIKKLASNTGLKEVINYSFFPKNALEKIKYTFDKEKLIDVLRPITEDFVTLRPTLIYNLIKNAKDNMNRNSNDIRFFEVSRTFEKSEELAKEELKFSIILAGYKEKGLWQEKPRNYDFYDLKGILEYIFKKLKFNSYQIKRSEQTQYHPGRSADIFVGRELIGSFGEIHPDVLENFDFGNKSVLVAEINLDLIKKYIKNNIKYEPLVKYPSVPRDFAFLVDEDLPVGDLVRTIEKISNKIESVELFDVYRGIGIIAGKKSVAISVVLRDKNKTLEEKEIVDISNNIVNKITKVYNAELR